MRSDNFGSSVIACLRDAAFLPIGEAARRHLSEPFKKLVEQIGDRGGFQRGQGLPMRVMCMSATGSGDDPDRFKLEPSDLEGTAEENPIVRRYYAKKWVAVHPPDDWKPVEKNIIDEAATLAGDGSRVVVFVRGPDDADGIAKGIQKKLARFPDGVEVLTGTMRGLERDELLAKRVFRRFLDGEEKPEERAAKGPCVLVSTSAGEVGFDLNADHMLCDAAPLDSMIQRLGRVNRRGYGDAIVKVFPVAEKEPKKGASDKPKHTFESATAAALKCLERLEASGEGGGRNASPKAMAELREKLTENELHTACAPRPATVELTDILLDAWSMTTIVKPMPGRPPVAAWLRGVEAEAAETTIAWRAELDLDGFGQLELEDVEEWFDSHRIVPHETLSVPSAKAKDWIPAHWNELPVELREAIGERPCIVDRAGLEVLPLRHLVEVLSQKRSTAIDDAQVVLPASFGGIENGMLGSDAEGPDPSRADVADARGRHRIVRAVSGDGEREVALTGDLPSGRSLFAQFALDVPSGDDSHVELMSLVPKRERREFGTREQPLVDHVGLVQGHVRAICHALGLVAGTRQSVELAAAWHDHGKGRDIWQRAAGRKAGEPLLGKSGGRLRRCPGGYRHEFGSLCAFIAAPEGKVPEDVFELTMHLIATHHGRGRPHFPKGAFDPDARAKSPEVAAGVVRRFALLQRKYGYWQLAWLENLLRCADAMASAEDGK
jgi:CRISPR-associated endonuclease/helicase Cas3